MQHSTQDFSGPGFPFSVLGVFLVILVLALYMLPWVLAYSRRHPEEDAIGFLNFFLGWTGVIWVLLFLWATLPSTEKIREMDRAKHRERKRGESSANKRKKAKAAEGEEKKKAAAAEVNERKKAENVVAKTQKEFEAANKHRICPNCKTEIESGKRVCPKCWTRSCPKCRTRLGLFQRHCRHCG